MIRDSLQAVSKFIPAQDQIPNDADYGTASCGKNDQKGKEIDKKIANTFNELPSLTLKTLLQALSIIRIPSLFR